MAVQKASKVTISRSEDKFTAKATVPSAAKKGNAKCDMMQVKWKLGTATHTETYKKVGTWSPTWTPNNTISAKTLYASVRLRKDKGNKWGAWRTQTFAMDTKGISWETPSVELGDDGKLTVKCAMSTTEDKTNAHHWRTAALTLKRTKHLADGTEEGPTQVASHSGRDTSYTLSWTAEKEEQTLNRGEYIKYEWHADRIGHAGTTTANAVKYVGWAMDPVIGAVSVDEGNDQVIVPVSAEWDATRPTNTIQLQYALVTATKADGIPESEWADVDGARGTAGTKGLSCTCTAIRATTAGYSCWLRVKATNELDSMPGVSEPVRIKDLSKPDASDEPVDPTIVGVCSIGAGADGESAEILVGWNDSDYNGTEVSYSDYVHSWESNKDATSFQMPDRSTDLGEATGLDGTEYKHSRWVYLQSLSESTTYWVCLRRYKQDDDTQTTSWTDLVSVTTGTTPAGVTLTVPSVVATGSDLILSWVVGGENTQTAWLLELDGEQVLGEENSASGCTVPSTVLEGKEVVSVVARVTTDGTHWYESSACSVTIRPLPTVAITTERIITKRGHQATLAAAAGIALSYRLLAGGVMAVMPDDTEDQYQNEVVWSGSVSSTGAEIVLAYPDTLNLVDGAEYWLEVTPSMDGLTGAVTIPTFDLGDGTTSTRQVVSWAHQAVPPSERFTTIVTDKEGLTATITPAKPDGYWLDSGTIDPEASYYVIDGDGWKAVADPSQEQMDAGLLWALDGYADGDTWSDDDVFDVYRSTPDGLTLVYEGLALGQSVTDMWAPYGEAPEYVICTRTADNDRSWRSYSYELASSLLRIDWERSNVSLRYDLELEDEWEKDFEGRKYLDGTTDGWWNDGVTRTASITANLVRFGDREDERLVRNLAKFAGEAFVRTPGGLAFAANIEVKKVSESAAGATVAVSLDVTEVRCQEHVASLVDVTGGD